MKNVKNTLAAFTMMFVLAFGTTFANAGIIIAGLNDKSSTTKTEDPCTQTSEKEDWGIIIAGVGIIIAGFTGIIIAGAAEEPTECGIIIAG